MHLPWEPTHWRPLPHAQRTAAAPHKCTELQENQMSMHPCQANGWKDNTGEAMQNEMQTGWWAGQELEGGLPLQ